MRLTFFSFDHAWIKSKRDGLSKSLVQYCKLRWMEHPTQIDPFFIGVMTAMAQSLFQRLNNELQKDPDAFQVNNQVTVNEKLITVLGPYPLPVRGHKNSHSLFSWNHQALLTEIQHALSVHSQSIWDKRNAYLNRLLGWNGNFGGKFTAPWRTIGDSSTRNRRYVRL